jgi:TP901 family phage tail tape measure protein
VAIKLFELGYKISMLGASAFESSLRGISGQVERLNSSFSKTSNFRQAGANLAMAGAGVAGVGAGVLYALKGAVDEAAALDASMHHLSTALDSGAKGQREYAQAAKFAEANSIKFNYAQTDIIDNLYRSISFTNDYNAALAVTSASLAVAKGNMGDARTVGEQLAIVWNDFGDKSKAAAPQIQHFADVMAYASRHGAFHDVNQLNAALTESIGAAKAAGMSYEDLVATIAGFSKVGMQGSEAGAAIEESLQAFARGGLAKLGSSLATFKNGSLDVIGTFANLKKASDAGTISATQFQAAAKALGIRGSRALAIDVSDLEKFRDTLHDPAIVKGAAMEGAAKILADYNEQMGILGQKWHDFRDKLGDQLLPTLTKIGGAVGSVVDLLNGFATAHPIITKLIVTFVAFGAALAVVAGGLAVLAGGVLALGSFMGIGTGLMLMIGGIGAAIAAAAALIITFWSPLKTFFTTMIPQAFNWGVGLLKSFAAGLWSAMTWPIHAVEHLGSVILDHFKMHSPAKLGPLRHFHDLGIVQTLAANLQPRGLAPALSRLALATMVAGPMMLAGAGAGGGGGGPTIVINYTANVTASSPADWRHAARANADELVQIIEAKYERRDRRRFD